MADVRAADEIVSEFILDICQAPERLNYDALLALCNNAQFAEHDDEEEAVFSPLTTGSVAEFYIKPMLSCVGDVDIMFHYSTQLAIPAGTAPLTQLPDEFHSRVDVCEIVDSEFAGYVYLVSSYLLTECIDDGKYNAAPCQRKYLTHVGDKVHGPAIVTVQRRTLADGFPPFTGRLSEEHRSRDTVVC